MQVEVEIFDANLNYNLLLGRSWTHAMHVVASYLFRAIHFPHQGKIVSVDQLSFFASSSSDDNVPYVKYSGAPYESVGVGLFKYSSLMGTFSLLSPSHMIEVSKVETCNMISSTSSDSWKISNNSEVDMHNKTMH